MEFRLTYEGPLYSTQREPRAGQPDPRAKHKHELRKAFHQQLKRYWQLHPYLKHGQPVTFDWPTSGSRSGTILGSDIAEWVASKNSTFGYRFVPLVRRDLSLLCSIEILFLRPEPPGAVLRSGDIDNRLKTIFDGLKMPASAKELGPYSQPEEGEDPFYCLLEDDSLITHVSVETDLLLKPTSPASDPSDARLVISVKIRPHSVNPSNASFG